MFRLGISLTIVLAGCVGASHPAQVSEGIDEVIDAPGASGEGYGDPEHAINGVRGGGNRAGSTDVYSLGYEVGVNNYIVLGWNGSLVTNGPGADFVVFENPFEVAPGNNFMDLVIVEVSLDREAWFAFPHDYIAEDENAYSSDPAAWLGFAGREPVLYDEVENPVDPFNAADAGGDAFDLENLPEIRDSGFRYLKLVSAPSQINPDTGEEYVRAAVSNGPDIDGVIARYLE